MVKIKVFDDIMSRLQAFSETGVIPSGGKIFKIKSSEFTDNPSDRYEDITKLLNDERIYSLVALTASLVQESYKGFFLRAEDRFKDKEITEKENKVLNMADTFEDPINGIDVKNLIFEIAFNVAIYGEDIFTYELDSELGVVGIPEVALNSAFFIDDKSQIKNTELVVRKGTLLGVKKKTDDTDPEIYNEDEFEHITYKKRGVWRKDIDGRNTFGVYSIVPGKCLINLSKWKLKTMENDILWKNKLLPRILHELDMTGITPSAYSGATREEKTTNALKDALKIIQNFKNNTKIDTPDEDLIVSNSVKTSILEAKSTSYQDPNGTLGQINNALSTPFGIPAGQLGGDSATSMGAQLDSFFESIRIETLANKIAAVFTKVVRKHIILLEPGLEEEAKRLYAHVDATIPAHKYEIARALLNLAQTGLLLKTEGRNMLKLPRNPQVKDAPLLESKDFVRSTTNQLIKNAKDETAGGNTNNEGPGAQKNTTQNQRDPGDKAV